MTEDSRIRGLVPYANFLVRYRVWLLWAAVLLTVLSFPKASQLTLEHSIESLYAPDDPHLLDYRESKSLFGGDEFVIVAYEDPQLLVPEHLDALRAFSDQLSQIPGVQPKSTENLANVLSPQLPTDMSRITRFLLAGLFQQRRDQLLDFSQGILVGADHQTTGIVLRLAPEDEATVPRDDTIRSIRELSAQHKLPQGEPVSTYVVGEPVLVHDMFQYVEEDGQRLFYASLGLLGLVIFVLFRSVRWVLLSVVLVGVTVVWTKAILVVCGIRLSMVSSMLNSLVTIVGIATVMRMMVYYREQRATFDPLGIVPQNGRRAVAGHLLDDRDGGRRLCFAPVEQNHAGPQLRHDDDAGDDARLGERARCSCPRASCLAAWGPTFPPAPPNANWSASWAGSPSGSSAAASGLSARSSCSRSGRHSASVGLKLDTDFSRNLRSNTPIVRALNFVETRLGGAGTWEVNFPAPPELTPEFLNQVRALADTAPQPARRSGRESAAD